MPQRSRTAAILLVPLAVAIVLALFMWPSSNVEPRDLPVAVAGAPAATNAIAERLESRDGAFDVHRYRDEHEARDAILDRDVYGAIVATPDGAKVLTATAASPTVAQMLTGVGTGMGAVEVEDAAPAPAEASGLASSSLPIIIAGSLTAMAAMGLATGARRRTGLVLTGSILSGLVAAAVSQSWLGVLDGDWFANAAALSLTVLAVSAVIAGLQALWGRAGMLAGALTMTMIGNPFAGVNASPDMLPEPSGTIGALMPPGAGGNLLRSTGYFDGAAAGGHIAVLAAWSAIGIAALLAAGVRARRPVAAPVPEPA